MRSVALMLMMVGATGLAANAHASESDGVVIQLTPMTTGASMKIGHYSPQRLTLAAEKPEQLKKSPSDLAAPLYGSLEFGAQADGTRPRVLVIIDEPDGKSARLFVDSNRNGDLTDDATAEWKTKGGEADAKNKMYSGGATIELGTGATSFPAHISMYRFDKNDESRAALKNVVLYYRDYAYEGEIAIGGRNFKCLLEDETAAGDFRGKDGKDGSGVKLLLDANGNGTFDARGEAFDVRAPFNIGGTTWEIVDMAADGSEFKIVKSTREVAEIGTPPDLRVGKKIPPFEATDMAGKAVKFPSDYKGHVVMLDFWATWCGPCMGEVPGLVKVFEANHDKGFEILGITLDNKGAEDKIKDVTGKKRMTWPQVYDGGGWKAALAQQYVITSIPAAFLVDGDTGEILAAGNTLRGEALAGTIQDALNKKAKAVKP